MVHPVQLVVEPPARIARVEVVIRLALLLALATVGYSSIYWCLYLAAPAVVALVVTKKGGAVYLAEDAPRVVRFLKWITTAYAYLWFLSNELPTTGAGPIELHVEAGGTPTVGSALGRLVTSLPALLLVVVLSVAAGVIWLVAAGIVLATERMPASLADFLALSLRVQLRFAAYHLSLVERYPSLEASAAVVQRRASA
jgi:hypothetical protein